MNTEQIKSFYIDKEHTESPLTEKLIKAGYQQEKDGYIDFAYDNEVTVDYRVAKPSQWWHLIISYCNRSQPYDKFSKRITCGELIFWMAEVSDCVNKSDLEDLADAIIASGISVKRRKENKPNFRYDRLKWNKHIQDLCFDKIVEKVESSGSNPI